MSAARPPLSIVIATRDRPEHLARCLDRLRPELGPDDEVVVVDSASVGDRPAAVARAAGATVVRADLPGTSRARNLGWRLARHDLVAFTDDDVAVDTGWPEAMARALTAGDEQWITGWIGVERFGGGAREFNPTMLESEPARLDGDYRGPMGASANFGAHRSALVAVGGFDERFGPGCWTAAAEDVELYDRLILAGLPGRYDPDVRVFHEQWRTRRDATTLHWRYGKGMGARLARLARKDPRRAARIGYDVVWSQGLHAVGRCLRVRYEFGALLALLRVSGNVVGFAAWMLRR